MQKLSVKGLALAFGIIWGVGCLIMGIGAMYGWAGPLVELMGSAYIGYGATVPGAFIGLAWGFADGFIGGAVFAWLYNKLSC